MKLKEKILLGSLTTNVLLVMASVVFVSKLLLGWALLSWVGIGVITWANEKLDDWGGEK